MNALERAKALSLLKSLFTQKESSTGLDKAKILKKIIETRRLLGFSVKEEPDNNMPNNDQNPNSVFQAVLDGDKTLSAETLQQVITEAVNNPDHYQLVAAAKHLLEQYNANDMNVSE